MNRYLEDIVPASQRRRVYAIFGLVSLLAGATQVSILTLGLPVPPWVNVVCAVLQLVGFPVSETARSNTPVADPQQS